MRDTSSWYEDLVPELEAAGSALTDRLTVRDLVGLELGLFFLDEHFPGEPVGALWPLLSGYVSGPEGLRPVLRRLRHLMGDIARIGYWRHRLDRYRRVPLRLRGFERTDAEERRIGDRSTFRRLEPAVCSSRFEVYGRALDSPVAYVKNPARKPAIPGRTYTFKCRGGREEQVLIPDDVAPLPPPPALETQRERRRESWSIDLDDDLTPVAKEIDEILGGKPEVEDGDYVGRLRRMVFSRVDDASGSLDEERRDLTFDGVEHVVGLMNSGKSTLADLVTVERVRKGFHVTLVLRSVTDVYAKVSWLSHLGIDAVPLVGRSDRAGHAANYWRTTLAASKTVFPAAADPAARFVSTVCLLEPARLGNRPEWSPLAPEDFPCRGRLTDPEKQRRLFDCPLLAVCPHQAAERRVAGAEVWVTTAAGLVASRAEPAAASMRWLEACQHRSDLIIVDEADAVLQDLDQRFLQQETLVAPSTGWTDRTSVSKLTGFDREQRRQLRNDDARRFDEYDQIHQRAVGKLYELALLEENRALLKILEDGPFTGYSLLLEVARLMHGLPVRESGDAAPEDAAEDFFRTHLECLNDEPFALYEGDIGEIISALTSDLSDEDRLEEVLDAWLLGHASEERPRKGLAERLGLLRLLFQAGYWCSRITTSFFEMATLHPAVVGIIPLEDPDSFWTQQPPHDYQALVPEAPMGNLLALQWLPSGDSGSLRVMWVRGVGRWLLHHLHDLLEPEGIEGPHVILTSATSWIPGSSFYHIPIRPTVVLREPPEDRAALMESSLAFRPRHRGDGTPIIVSGRQGPVREDALRDLAARICSPQPGETRSLLDQIRVELDEDRRQVLLVVLSGRDARLVTEHINTHTHLTARNVTPDAEDVGDYGLHRRMVANFAETGADILVAAEMAIQRGYNILNAKRTAALGAVFYLARPHPPPTDPRFPLSLINQKAMEYLLYPVVDPPSVGDAARSLRARARADWYGLMSRPVYFRRLEDGWQRDAFVANSLVPLGQTIGRTIRGHRPTRVLLCDAAFAPRHADPRDDAADTRRTSLIVAADEYLSGLLAPPQPDAGVAQRRDHAVAEAVWGLVGHLLGTRDMGR